MKRIATIGVLMALAMVVAISGTAVAQPAEEAPIDNTPPDGTPLANDVPPEDGETPNLIIILSMEDEVNPPADPVENAPPGEEDVEPPAPPFDDHQDPTRHAGRKTVT